MTRPLRLLGALWFGLAGALPGSLILQLEAGKVGGLVPFVVLLLALPAASAALWGALLGPKILTVNGHQGFKRSLLLGASIPLLALLLWAPLASLAAVVLDAYSVKLILFVAFSGGGFFIYPAGMLAGMLLWLIARVSG